MRKLITKLARLGAVCFIFLQTISLSASNRHGSPNELNFSAAAVCDLVFTVENSTDEICFGANDGTISVEATATGAVEYNLNGGAFSSQNNWTALAPGTYTVIAQIVGDPACFEISNFIIFQGTLPQPDLTGDLFPCSGSTQIYTTPFHAGSSWVWNLSGGGQIVSQNQNSISVHWTGAPGANFSISVTETDSKGCSENDQISVSIRQTIMICNDIVQVSLGDNCKTTISPDMILEGTYQTFDGIMVNITPIGGNGPASGGTMGNMILAKGTYKVTVNEPCTGNSCWATIHAEDKQGPIFDCKMLEIPCTKLDTAATIPNLAGMPLDVTIGGLNGVTIHDNCGIVTVFYSDEFTAFDCPANFVGKLTRNWTAIDMSGNVGTCSQMIRILDPILANVVFPKDTFFTCLDKNFAPSRAGSPTLDGFPLFPNSPFCKINAAFEDDTLDVCDGTFKILRTWTVFDWCLATNIPGMPGFDSNLPVNPRRGLQIIKIEDKNLPTFICPVSVKAEIDPFNCTGYIDLPDVIVNDACSRIYSAVAKFGNGFLNGQITTFPGNNLWLPDTMARFGILENLPLGDHEILYEIKDDCNNVGTCTFQITVEDDAPPTAVCVENTKVGVGIDGTASVSANVFDHGSTDNCGQIYFKARRMDGDPCNLSASNLFDDRVKFCCDDIGKIITVIVRVYDQQPDPGKVADFYLQNHGDDCMVQVKVEDKLKPYCAAPHDVTVDCSAFDPTLWAYGTANVIDNCEIDTVTISINYNDFDTICHRGMLRRTFTGRDSYGNASSCQQKITVNYNTNYKVRFPDDILVNTCNGATNYGEPIFTGKDCETPAVSYTDEVFNLVPDACFKILRKWKVADWCNFDANAQPIFVPNPLSTDVGQLVSADNFNKGYFTYWQVIKVVDNQKPMITDCPVATIVVEDVSANDPTKWNKPQYWDEKHQSHDLCESPAPLSISATDACSGANLTILYSIQLDWNGDGVFDLTLLPGQAGAPILEETVNGSIKTVSIHPNFEFPHGKHRISWIVRDGCGNEATCQFPFIIRDGKAPTVVCHNGLAVNIMPTKMIQIWASDFVQYVQDNCTPADQLVLSIRKTGSGTGFPTDAAGNPILGLTFDCDDLGTVFVEIWAKDKAGNAAFCETYILIQDNNSSCNQTTAQVAGSLETEDVDAVENAKVKISGSSNAFPAPNYFTGNDGKYNFNALPIGDDYLIEPNLNENWLNGVTTYDLLLISRHIMGVKPFETPYKTIAADANRTGSVTTNDIVQLRKLILGVIDTIPGNTSWRFVPRNHPFSNPQNPWAGAGFPEKMTVADLQSNLNGGDFVGLKTGDVNNNALANGLMASDDRTKSGKTLHFETDEKLFRGGDEFTVKFSSDDLARVLGYQFSLAFDPAFLEITDLAPGNLPDLTAENFGTSHLSEGILTTSFHTNYIGIGRKEVFTLHFKAKKAGRLSQILQLSNRITPTEAYSREEEKLDVVLRFLSKKGATEAGVGFELYQNTPNPFNEKTSISFNLPDDAKVVLTISDARGKILQTQKGKFERGVNAFEILKKDLPDAGVLFYKLETPFGNDSKKMILMNR